MGQTLAILTLSLGLSNLYPGGKIHSHPVEKQADQEPSPDLVSVTGHITN